MGFHCDSSNEATGNGSGCALYGVIHMDQTDSVLSLLDDLTCYWRSAPIFFMGRCFLGFLSFRQACMEC